MDISKYRKRFLDSSEISLEPGRKLGLNSSIPYRAMCFTNLIHCSTDKKCLPPTTKILQAAVKTRKAQAIPFISM